MPQDFTNTEQAVRALRANLTPRQIELENLERYAKGTQYEGLPDWFSDDVPLWERAPCIVYKQTAAGIRSNVSLILGKGRQPRLSAKPGEDDSELGGLDEEASVKVDGALKVLFQRTRYWSIMRQALTMAQQTKSVAVIAGARAGRPFLELVKAPWCTPEFDVHKRVTRLEIRYPYLTPEKQPDGKWKLAPKLYRRVIDDTSDTTYLPIDAQEAGIEPREQDWKADPARTVAHKLGFCPVHWYALRADANTVAEYDGHALHENTLDEIRALDFTLSQRHRAALFLGDPQIVEIGVEPGTNPSAAGREAMVGASKKGGMPSGANPLNGVFKPANAPKMARVKSPGGVWQYERNATEVRVEYLELSPGALTALDNNAADLRNKIAESLAIVILDPTNVKFAGDMSGKAIEQIRALQFDACDEIADDCGANLLIPVALLLMRVACATNLAIKAVRACTALLQSFLDDEGEAPLLFLHWPSEYTKPSAQDQGNIVTFTVAARTAPNGPLCTRRQAVERLAGIFGTESPDQVLEELEKEDGERDADTLEKAKALMGAKAKAGAGAPPNAGGEESGAATEKEPPASEKEPKAA